MEKTKNNLYEIGAVISYYEKSATGYESLRKQKFIPVEGLFYDEENKILVFGKDYDETKYNIGTGNDNEFMISRNVVFKGGSKNINEFGDFSYHELFYTKKRKTEMQTDCRYDLGCRNRRTGKQKKNFRQKRNPVEKNETGL